MQFQIFVSRVKMSIELNTQHKNLLDGIVKGQGFKDYVLDAQTGSLKGDGYTGVIITVTVTDKTDNKQLHLVLKAAHENNTIRTQLPLVNIYKREIFVYETVFTKFRKFQDEFPGSRLFDAYPRYFGSCLEEAHVGLVLENIKFQDYKLWDRRTHMNGQHVAIVLKEYGLYHGLSLAMKNLRRKQFYEIASELGDPLKDKKLPIKDIMQKGIKLTKDEGAKQALIEFSEFVDEYLQELLAKEDKSWVLTHGDCWCNNMMFKYEDVTNPDKPTKVKLLDFQMSKFIFLMNDIIYFFYVNSSMEVINNYETYLKIYHKSLSSTLRDFGFNPDEIYSYQDLLADFKKYSKVGIVLSLIITHVMYKDEDEVKPLDTAVEEGKEFFSQFLDDIKKSDLFEKRINDIVMFQYKNGFLRKQIA